MKRLTFRIIFLCLTIIGISALTNWHRYLTKYWYFAQVELFINTTIANSATYEKTDWENAEAQYHCLLKNRYKAYRFALTTSERDHINQLAGQYKAARFSALGAGIMMDIEDTIQRGKAILEEF